MARADNLDVTELTLDLANYRTVPQPTELEAVKAMIASSPDRFWALMESVLTDGYLPTENIIVLEEDKDTPTLTVKEGNRRVAALKLLNNALPRAELDIPRALGSLFESRSSDWIKENSIVPCRVYPVEEAEIVDRIVTLAHGKGEKAGRDQWNAVARARHRRDQNGGPEPALDLLEKYLKYGQNLTKGQAVRWAGDYPLTVLEEAMKKLAPRLEMNNARHLAATYPKIKDRSQLEGIMRDIGLRLLKFKDLRNTKEDFGNKYDITASHDGPPENGIEQPEEGKPATGRTAANSARTETKSEKKGEVAAKKKSYSLANPKSVKGRLQHFEPRGTGREKVVALRDEARSLNLRKTPLAFCFVLRSMFEISAKAYCTEKDIRTTKRRGKDKTLVAILRDVTSNITNAGQDQARVKQLHGAMAELARPEGLLSVTSMNQLVHNPSFSITTRDICGLFGNIFPLLEAMND